MPKISLLLTLALLLILPLEATAQVAQLQEGQRVRIQLLPEATDLDSKTPAQTLRGDLVRNSADSLSIRIHPSAAPASISSDAIRRVDVSRGIRSRFESVAYNAPRAAGIYALTFAFIDGTSQDPLFGNVWQSALAGAVTGAVSGTIAGLFRQEERWERVEGW